MTSKTKRLHFDFGCLFVKSKHIQRFWEHFPIFCPNFHRFCPDFKLFCPNFHQIKGFGGAVVPPPPLLPTPVEARNLSQIFNRKSISRNITHHQSYHLIQTESGQLLLALGWTRVCALLHVVCNSHTSRRMPTVGWDTKALLLTFRNEHYETFLTPEVNAHDVFLITVLLPRTLWTSDEAERLTLESFLCVCSIKLELWLDASHLWKVKAFIYDLLKFVYYFHGATM